MNAGKVVATHEAEINFNGWIGDGYIMLDTETGSGTYMIAGGGNGGHLTLTDIAAITLVIAGVLLVGAFF